MDMLLTSLDWNNISSSIESLSRMKKWLSTAKAVRKLLSMPEVDKLNSFIFAGPDWLKVAKDNPSAILAMTEAISVLGNCCFLESEMSIFVKNHKLLAVVGKISFCFMEA